MTFIKMEKQVDALIGWKEQTRTINKTDEGDILDQCVGETDCLAQNKQPPNLLRAPVSTEEQNPTSPLPTT